MCAARQFFSEHCARRYARTTRRLRLSLDSGAIPGPPPSYPQVFPSCRVSPECPAAELALIADRFTCMDDSERRASSIKGGVAIHATPELASVLGHGRCRTGRCRCWRSGGVRRRGAAQLRPHQPGGAEHMDVGRSWTLCLPCRGGHLVCHTLARRTTVRWCWLLKAAVTLPDSQEAVRARDRHLSGLCEN